MQAITSNWAHATATLVALALGTASAALSASEPVPGQMAPTLIAQSFSGQAFDLSTVRGKVVVVNFWASWCGPCRSEMPMLEALQRDYPDHVVVIGLSADDPHDRKDAQKAAQAVRYFTGMLTEARTNGFGAPQVLPLTYIIGPEGTLSAILRANQGPLSAEQLRAAVDSALRTGAGR